MKDDAYQAIARRLEEFERSGDARCVTDPQALDEVAALRAAIGWPAFHAFPDDAVIRRELDAILLAGRFLLARVRSTTASPSAMARISWCISALAARPRRGPGRCLPGRPGLRPRRRRSPVTRATPAVTAGGPARPRSPVVPA